MFTDEIIGSPLTIAVLAGGESAERQVSLASGAQAVDALESAGHRVEMFDPAEIDLEAIAWQRFDACFIALHGGPGEDGRVQQRLAQLGVCYTGSGPAASRLAMSKSASKERFFQAGVPTLPYVLFHVTDPLEQVAAQVMRLGYPLVVKPDSQGSSLGVGLAHRADELSGLIAAAGKYDPFVMAEMYVDGREFTVTILGRRALPLLEILTPHRFFDYQAKYHSSHTEYCFEPGLELEKVTQLQQTAVAAAATLETSGLVRVDLLLDAAGFPWVLEVNSVPGMTATSMAPKAAAQAGLDLPTLCDWMVRDALKVEVSR